MPGARYQVDSLVVEGFKAFGVQQEIRVSGKHCFLFGANARGKSSIVEAIRWCLFGLERDSDVRNRFSEGADCRVELRLRDAAGLWRLERRLRPGQLRSDLTIKNPRGEEVTQKEALPNLVRLGPGAGAVVFFSAQQAARARAYADLTRFHEVLYAHLDLGEAERLRTELTNMLQEQMEIEQQRAGDLQSAEDTLREKLKGVDDRLEELLRRPPWELDEPPTRTLSETRVRSLVAELADECGAEVNSGWECPEALEHAERWAHDLSVRSRAALSESGASLRRRREELLALVAAIRDAQERAAAAQARVAELDRQLAELCDGTALEELEACWQVASASLDREAQLARARKAVAPLLGADARECPICGLACDGAELLAQLEAGIEQADAAQQQAAEEVEALGRRKAQAQVMAKQRDAASREHESARRKTEELVGQIVEQLGCSSEDWESAAEARLTILKQQIAELQQDGERSTQHGARQRQRIDALRAEWRYHQLRDEQQRVREELQEGLQPARDRLRALEDFRSRVDLIARVVREEFDAAVDRALPTVSRQLTETFRRLTAHPAFDDLRVERAGGADELVVRVASSRARVPWSRPEDVLNGGAYAALGLIPYFVFSGFHAEQAEMNVLIIDDPSQSFDTTHVELLLEELRRASEHAQLVLATHEEDRFRPIVERLFPDDSFTVVRVTDFRPDRGPTIEQG
ncbi:MAG TPA: AAA family ATPase [Gemmatimonadaceae bacterium]|nr:AAA family ATPase [Gemmatimonadaceae bacterium]